MIASSHIDKTLKDLDKLYNSATSQKKAIYYSKLALIELCGWIEETLDNIVIKHANRKLKLPCNKKYYSEKIVMKTYGFDYKANIRPMFIGLVGIIEVEKIEKKLDKQMQLQRFKSQLGNLKAIRNDAAHTHLKGVTRVYNAPSYTIREFSTIKQFLEKIDSELRMR